MISLAQRHAACWPRLLGLAQLAAAWWLMADRACLLSTVFYASLYFTFVDCFMFGAPNDLLAD